MGKEKVSTPINDHDPIYPGGNIGEVVITADIPSFQKE